MKRAPRLLAKDARALTLTPGRRREGLETLSDARRPLQRGQRAPRERDTASRREWGRGGCERHTRCGLAPRLTDDVKVSEEPELREATLRLQRMTPVSRMNEGRRKERCAAAARHGLDCQWAATSEAAWRRRFRLARGLNAIDSRDRRGWVGCVGARRRQRLGPGKVVSLKATRGTSTATADSCCFFLFRWFIG